MLRRTMFTVLAAALSIGAVVAQQDPVTTHENLMKENNKHEIGRASCRERV